MVHANNGLQKISLLSWAEITRAQSKHGSKSKFKWEHETNPVSTSPLPQRLDFSVLDREIKREQQQQKSLTSLSSSLTLLLSCFTLAFSLSVSAVISRFFLANSTILAAATSPAKPDVPEKQESKGHILQESLRIEDAFVLCPVHNALVLSNPFLSERCQALNEGNRVSVMPAGLLGPSGQHHGMGGKAVL